MQTTASMETLEVAAEKAGVRLHNVRRCGKNRIAFVIRTSGPTTNGRPVRWGRVSQTRTTKEGLPRRVPGAVCWHGHREFMREVFRLEPEALIITGLARYNGSKHFERTHEYTYHLGASYYGFRMPYGGACDCEA